ncbi:MAG: polysaccharide lyase, partial [Actinomycetota bacterium]|nr:polysaccharide lyase [Actinomycetota bacterium]
MLTSPAGGAEAVPIFADDFETGDLRKWSSSRRVTVQGVERYWGTYGARATGAGVAADATRILSTPFPELYYRTRFKILSQGAHSLTILGMRRSGGSTLLSVYVKATGRLSVYNGITGTNISSTTAVSKGAWHDVQLHVRIAGTRSQVEVWLNGARVTALSRTVSLGTNPIGRLQLGEHSSGRSFEVAFDDVGAAQAFLASPSPEPSPSP